MKIKNLAKKERENCRTEVELMKRVRTGRRTRAASKLTPTN
jgi:hypothetical protein